MDPVPSTSNSNRILYDVPCAVCGDHSSGKHYGIYACDGCAGFFKRSVRRNRQYTCKARPPSMCLIDKAHRNQCRACRFARCCAAGMNRDAVQHERGPRIASTLRRQMSLFMNDSMTPGTQQPITIAAERTRPVANHFSPPVTATAPDFPFPYNSRPILRGPLINIPRGPPPPFVTELSLNHFDPEAMCESSARLLFMNVSFTKNIPSFDSLSLSDRLILLEESWKDLFIIGCAQYLYPMHLMQFIDGNRMLSFKDINVLELVLTEVVKIRPDTNELCLLRIIAVFRTAFSDCRQENNLRRFQDLRSIRNSYDKAQTELKIYSTRTFPLEPGRYCRLLRLIPLFNTVSRQLIVELFFRATIGDIPIERIIGDLYRAEKQSE